MRHSLGPTARSSLYRIALCVLTGVLYALASPPAHIHLLCWVLFVPLLWAVQDCTPKKSFLYGWTAGCCVHLFCFYWVAGTIQRYSNLSIPLSLVALVLFCLYSGLPFGLIAFLGVLVRLRTRVPGIIALPCMYVTMEYLYPFIFPWNVGAGQYEVLPIIQIADLFGVYGVSALVISVNCAVYELLRNICRKTSFPLGTIVWALLLCVSTVSYGVARMKAVESALSHGTPLTVGIVQPNVLLEERATPLLAHDIALRYTRLSKEAADKGAALIIWPESAVNFVFQPHGSPSSPSGKLRDHVRELKTPLLFGSVSSSMDGMRNTAYLLDAEGTAVGHYDKVRLLAFGEYMPFSDLIPQLNGLVQGVGDFKPGQSIDPLCWDGTCLGVLICYEAILKDLARKMANRGAAFLVNITNDAWFGATSCPEQHLMLASFRAVENRLYLARSANTGISAVVDPVGRIRSRTALFTQASVVETIRLVHIPTLYRAWGDRMAHCCTAVTVVLILYIAAVRLRTT